MLWLRQDRAWNELYRAKNDGSQWTLTALEQPVEHFSSDDLVGIAVFLSEDMVLIHLSAGHGTDNEYILEGVDHDG